MYPIESNGPLRELSWFRLESYLTEHLAALVMMYKPGCPYCDGLRPTMIALAKDYQDRAAIGQLNVVAFPEARERFQIKTVPYLVFYSHGTQYLALQGDERARTEIQLRAHLDACLK